LVAFPAEAAPPNEDIIQSSTSLNGAAWSTPADLFATGLTTYSPQVTVSSTGLATAVWERYNGSSFIIQSSTSQNGAAWSTPVNLSAANGDASSPQVTVSSTGLATAVWNRDDGSHYIIQSSTSLNGAAWSTPVNVSLTGGFAYGAQVTVSSTGLATAVWSRFDGSNDIIQSSTSLNGAAWIPAPADLSASGESAYAPQVTVSSTGLATAVWARANGSSTIIQSSTSQNGAAWSTPADLSAIGEQAAYPQVTVSSTGLATAVWYRDDGSHYIIQSSTSQSGAAWSTPADLSATEQNASDPQVTVSSTGLATAVWYRDDGSHYIIQSSTSQSGAAWSTPVNVSLTSGNAYGAQVTVSSTGLATAVWARYNGSNYIIQSSTSQNGAAWSTPVNLSAANGDASYPQVTVSSTGLATAVWQKPVGSNNIIQSSTPTTTTLAATGADLQWLVLGSLLAVLAGAGFFALGRRKRTV
jgi:LPXTG-motif cell wall-anchored protein